MPPEVAYPTNYSAIIAQAQLVETAGTIYHEFLLARTAGAKIDYGVAERMEGDLLRWRRGLPSYFFWTDERCPSWFRGPRAVVLWKEQNLRVLLWRGTQMYHDFSPSRMSAAAKCLHIAMHHISDIRQFCVVAATGLLHPGVAWYATYFLMQATLVLEAYLVFGSGGAFHENPGTERAELQSCIASSQACLEILATSDRSASRCSDILDRIHERFEMFPYGQPDRDSEAVVQDVGLTSGAQSSEPSLTSQDFLASHGRGVAETLETNELVTNAGDPPNSGNGPEMLDMQSLLDGASAGFMDIMPLDLLFGNWTS